MTTHRHRAVKIKTYCWDRCVNPEKRHSGIEHGNVVILQTCRCGAERAVEENVHGSVASPWEGVATTATPPWKGLGYFDIYRYTPGETVTPGGGTFVRTVLGIGIGTTAEEGTEYALRRAYETSDIMYEHRLIAETSTRR